MAQLSSKAVGELVSRASAMDCTKIARGLTILSTLAFDQNDDALGRLLFDCAVRADFEASVRTGCAEN